MRAPALSLGVLSLGVLLSVAAASPVLAAQASPSGTVKPRDVFNTSPMPLNKGLAAVHDYTACLASRRPHVVRGALNSDYNSPEFVEKLRTLGHSNNSCVEHVTMRMAPVLYAGNLAEAAFLQDYAGRNASTLFPADWQANPITAVNREEGMALCIVMRHPDDVQALFATPVASPAEAAAMKPLVGEVADCLQGGQIALKRPLFRSLLALAMYHAARHFAAGEEVMG